MEKLKSADKQLERFYAKDRKEWREWLEKNHAAAAGVWLIYYKKSSGKPRVSYDDAVEEALCFGWIDSRSNPIDEECYMQFYSPRKAKSGWSKLNKQRIEKLIEQGLMAPAGLEKIEIAKQNGSWNILDEIEELKIPADLAQALAANELANGYFNAFSNSSKKQMLLWIASAKRPETRSKRIEHVVTLAAQNKKL